MLLGPIFVPMLYQVNPEMTPDLVAAAYRVADSSTNIITPMMVYSGVVLAFMRKYKPQLTFGDMIVTMLPYSITFLVFWIIPHAGHTSSVEEPEAVCEAMAAFLDEQ